MLPESYKDIKDTIGEEAACKLCERYGGDNLYIPKTGSANKAATPESYKDIMSAIGEEAANELCRYFGGEIMYVPKAETVSKIKRNMAIIADSKRGMSGRKICKKYGLSSMRISQILRQHKKNQ